MALKKKLREILDEQTTMTGRMVDGIIQFLILFSLVSFSIQTLPNLDNPILQILQVTEAIIIVIFTVEYILRALAAEKPLRYATSFFGIIDLLAILPYYVAIGLDLRAVRLFRVLRIIRFFNLPRYSKAINRLRVAFRLAREDLVMFSAVAFILFYVAAVGIYYFEHKVQPEAYGSIFHSMWWSVVTLTTVGYGDVVPITVGGKIFTFFVLMIGLGLVSAPAGILASALSEAREIIKREEQTK